MTETDTRHRQTIANPQTTPRQELVAHQSGELAPVSMPEVAERLAGAVAAMTPDQIYADITFSKSADGGTTAKLSFRAFKTKPTKGVFD